MLLHGFPSSARMLKPLLDHLAEIMTAFVTAVGLQPYAMVLQDYGGPVGLRMAQAHP